MQGLMEFCPTADQERRSKQRLYAPVPVTVWGNEENGMRYIFRTVSENVSSEGLCAFAPRIMKTGEKLTVRIRFAVPGTKPAQAPVIALRATVLRVREYPDGSCIFAAFFPERRLSCSPGNL